MSDFNFSFLACSKVLGVVMGKLNSKALKKQFILTTVGFFLQFVGSICVIAASINMHKMIQAKLKEVFNTTNA